MDSLERLKDQQWTPFGTASHGLKRKTNRPPTPGPLSQMSPKRTIGPGCSNCCRSITTWSTPPVRVANRSTLPCIKPPMLGHLSKWCSDLSQWAPGVHCKTLAVNVRYTWLLGGDTPTYSEC